MNISEAQGWVLIIVAVTSGFASLIAAWKATSAKQDTAAVKVQQTAMAEKVDTVEVNTNSRVARQDALITALSEQVATLTAQLTQQDRHIADLVADARRRHAPPAP